MSAGHEPFHNYFFSSALFVLPMPCGMDMYGLCDTLEEEEILCSKKLREHELSVCCMRASVQTSLPPFCDARFGGCWSAVRCTVAYC